MTKDLGTFHVLMDDLGPGPALQRKSDNVSTHIEIVRIALQSVLVGLNGLVKPSLIGISVRYLKRIGSPLISQFFLLGVVDIRIFKL